MGKKDNESHLLRIAAFAGEVGTCNDLQVANLYFCTQTVQSIRQRLWQKYNLVTASLLIWYKYMNDHIPFMTHALLASCTYILVRSGD